MDEAHTSFIERVREALNAEYPSDEERFKCVKEVFQEQVESLVPFVAPFEPAYRVERDKENPKLYTFYFNLSIPRSSLTE